MYFVDLFWDFKYLNAVSPVQKTQYGYSFVRRRPLTCPWVLEVVPLFCCFDTSGVSFPRIWLVNLCHVSKQQTEWLSFQKALANQWPASTDAINYNILCELSSSYAVQENFKFNLTRVKSQHYPKVCRLSLKLGTRYGTVKSIQI